ncbi:DUF192 domain-containing protein [Candidatus Falkowbacteria bacterium]|nr:DUF192 domain-containing protein [Candidatus Falkowbacteria bacterium]
MNQFLMFEFLKKKKVVVLGMPEKHPVLRRMFLFFQAVVIIVGLCLLVVLPRQVIFDNGVKVKVERADSFIEKQEGLMFRDKLEDGHGMLFIFRHEGQASFWMKNMKFPLDLIFISKDKKIVDIKQNFQPCLVENCPVYKSVVAAQYVLEVNAGFVEKNKISIGDSISFSCSWF